MSILDLTRSFISFTRKSKQNGVYKTEYFHDRRIQISLFFIPLVVTYHCLILISPLLKNETVFAHHLSSLSESQVYL